MSRWFNSHGNAKYLDSLKTCKEKGNVGEPTRPDTEIYFGEAVITTVVQDRQTENGAEKGSELDPHTHVNIWSLVLDKDKAVQRRKHLQSRLCSHFCYWESVPFSILFFLGQSG